MTDSQYIRRSYPFNRKTFIALNLVFWKFTWLRTTKHIKGFAYASVALLTLGTIALKNNEINPFIGLGIAFAIFSITLLILRLNAKKTFTNVANQVAYRYDSTGIDHGYELTELTFKFWDAEKQLILNWSAIKSCTVYKGHLILHIDHGPFAYFLFDKKEDCLNDYDRILEIISSKIPVEEIS